MLLLSSSGTGAWPLPPSITQDTDRCSGEHKKQLEEVHCLLVDDNPVN
jgi:hypothetical protein